MNRFALFLSSLLFAALTNVDACGCKRKPKIYAGFSDKHIDGAYRVKVLGKGADKIKVKKTKKNCYGKKDCDYYEWKKGPEYYVVQLIYTFKGCAPVPKRKQFAIAAGDKCDADLDDLLEGKYKIGQVLVFANDSGKTVGDDLPLYESNSCYPNRPWQNIGGKGRNFLFNQRPYCKGKKFCPNGKMPDSKGKCFF